MKFRLGLVAVLLGGAGCGGGGDEKRATSRTVTPKVPTAPIQMSCREALKDPKVPEEIKRQIREMYADAPEGSCGTYGVP